MKRLLEIDDECVPTGWEPVAFRVPVIGDTYIGMGKVAKATSNTQCLYPKLIVTNDETSVSRAHIGAIVLVANVLEGPYVQRVLVEVTLSRDYPFVCESIDSRAPDQCWRFAKFLIKFAE